MSLRSQKRIAASLLKAGESRVWIDPEEVDRVGSAITREEIATLIKEGRIRAKPKTGVSRGRARARAGRRRKMGSRKGGLGLGKSLWVDRIRALRRQLRGLRDKRQITPQDYKVLVGMAKGGAFRSTSHVDEYMKTHQMLRKR